MIENETEASKQELDQNQAFFGQQGRGKGREIQGGRFNSKGKKVYTSQKVYNKCRQKKTRTAIIQ